MTELSTLALAALAVFAERPRHAYEVYSVMRDRHEEGTVRLSAGSLYRAVQKLAEDELLAPIGTDREGNRPERTTYQVTEHGHRTLRTQVGAMLVNREAEYPQFPVAVAELHLLPAAEVSARLSERLVSLDAELACYDRQAELLEAKSLPQRFWLDLRLLQTLLRAERDWCAAVVGDIDSGRIDWAALPADCDPITIIESRMESTL